MRFIEKQTPGCLRGTRAKCYTRMSLLPPVQGNLQLALNVLVSEDIASARQLVVEKEAVGVLERTSVNQHFIRLRKGDPNSFETSEVHLQTVRSLRHINSLLCGVAYSILSDQGELLDTKLAGGHLR